MLRKYGITSVLIVLVLVVAVSVLERLLAIGACGGEYIYPIDDTYIHLAMARNLAEHGIWGVEAERMAFCSSSPLWTLVLASVYWLCGAATESLAWFLSLSFNLGSVALVALFLSRIGTALWVQICGALAVAVAGPFICTTALGMEHAMHAFFLMAAILATRRLPERGGRGFVIACLAAFAATATRYESLFLLLPLGVGLMGIETFLRWRGQNVRIWPVRSMAFLVAAGLPVFLYGGWAILNGGHFLPNSLLLKGSFRTFPQILRETYVLMGSVKPGCGFLYALATALVTVICLRGTPFFWRVAAGAAFMAIGGQMLFADVGQLCRYEAYLTSSAALIVVAAVAEGRGIGEYPVAFAPLAVFGLVAFMFVGRAERSLGEAVHSSSDIRYQQVLMTRILAELPEEDRGCVALNDLGYMALHGGFPILDIWGLGSQDVAELLIRHGKCRDPEDIEHVFKKHQVKYVAVFEKWFPMQIMPEGTVDVACLRLKDNFACGSDTVMFRALSEKDADALARHLEKYADSLPPRAELKFRR